MILSGDSSLLRLMSDTLRMTDISVLEEDVVGGCAANHILLSSTPSTYLSF
jgi:hypothetical protein